MSVRGSAWAHEVEGQANRDYLTIRRQPALRHVVAVAPVVALSYIFS
jgi:hypothetical protein